MTPVASSRPSLICGLFAALFAALLPARSQAPLPIRQDSTATTVVVGERLWLPPFFRSGIVTARDASIPHTATTQIDGAPYYFVDLGGGWYERRPVRAPVDSRERIVVDGAFLLKSEWLR